MVRARWFGLAFRGRAGAARPRAARAVRLRRPRLRAQCQRFSLPARQKNDLTVAKDGHMASAAIAIAIERLKELMPGRVETGRAVRDQHANTLTWIACEPPDVVVWPRSVSEVSAVLALAHELAVPVVPFGAGTSLEGQVNAPKGGISLDLSHMNRIRRLSIDDQDIDVECGTTLESLETHLRDSGLFFSVDPGSRLATVGGLAATRASGTNTVRYGSMRDNVLGLTAVLADGRVIETGSRARKSAAGYDLTRLLIGSEGTLAVITGLTLRLHPRPASIAVAVAPFGSIEDACHAAVASLQCGLGVARIELLDAVQMWAVNRQSKLTLAELPTLFVEFHGTPGATRDAIEVFAALARDNGAGAFASADAPEERRRLWQARHDAFWAVRSAWPGKSVLATDVCVPISRLAECVSETRRDLDSSGLTATIVGHVGDGNFHAIPVFDAANPGEVAAVRGVLDRLVARALAMGGTSTGEHGIGQGKARFLAEEAGPAIDVMRAIKGALDPRGILNPGKLFA